MDKVKHCKTCDFCRFFWIAGRRGDRRQYYCERKLQQEWQHVDGRQRNAYIRPMDIACNDYSNWREG